MPSRSGDPVLSARGSGADVPVHVLSCARVPSRASPSPARFYFPAHHDDCVRLGDQQPPSPGRHQPVVAAAGSGFRCVGLGRRRTSREASLVKIITGAALLLVVFLVSFLPPYVKSTRLNGELREARQENSMGVLRDLAAQ